MLSSRMPSPISRAATAGSAAASPQTPTGLPASRGEHELGVLRRRRDRRAESDAAGSVGDHDGLLVERF
jgi:hypothetical protein